MIRTASARLVAAAALMATAALTAAAVPLSGAFAGGVVAPAGLTPDSAGDWQKNLVLAWDEVSGASSYVVAVSSEGFDADGPVMTRTVTTNQFAPPVSLPRGDYEWRVKTVQANGEQSGWSASAHFLRGWDPTQTPTLTDVSASPVHVMLEWSPLPDASYYEIAIAEKPQQPGDVPTAKSEVAVCYTTHTSFTPATQEVGSSALVDDGAVCEGTLSEGVAYFFRVRGRDGTAESPQGTFAQPSLACHGAWTESTYDYAPAPECSHWSNEVSTVLGAPPGPGGVPSTLATYDDNDQAFPCDATTACADAPLMVWEDTGSAQYRIYLSRDPLFYEIERAYKVLGSQFRVPDTLPDRALPWYWRVQALDGSWVSDAASFAIKNAKPTTVAAEPQVADGVVQTSHVDFLLPTSLGKADHDARSWQLQVSAKSDFSSTVLDKTFDRRGTAAGFAAYRAEDLPDTTLYWRFRAVDQTGRVSPWSATVTFEHDSAAPKVSPSTKSGFGLKSAVTITSTTALSGVTSSTLGVRLKGGEAVAGSLTKVSAKQWTFTPSGYWIANAPYQVWVGGGVTDAYGRSPEAASTVIRPTGTVDSASPVMKKVAGDFGWTTRTSTSAVGGSYASSRHQAGNPNAPYVQVKAGGTSVALYACKGPSFGLADVYIDGAKVSRVDLYKEFSGCGQVFQKSGLADKVHTVKVVVTGKRNDLASGNYVGIDAVKAS